MRAEPLLVGCDVGTTAAKGGVFDLEGNLLALAERSYGIHRPRPGWAEQNPEEWWRALLGVLEELGRAVDLDRAAGIAVCSQVNTHVFADADGVPLAPAIVWQDQRCSSIASKLGVDASFPLARAAWFREEYPDEWRRVRWILSPKDYLNLRLCGEVATDAISPIGLVAPDLSYDEEVFELVPGTRELMPPIRHFADALGSVSAAEAGLPREAMVAIATMDAWGNVFGSRLTEAGDAMEVAGTSEIIGVMSEQARPAAGVVTFHPIDGLYLHAGPTQSGGDALRWFADCHGITIEAALAAAAEADPGIGGLVFTPYLMGERAPLWDADARGAFFGIGAEHRFTHFARAVLEGVAFSARHLLEAIETAAARRADALNSSGGGAASDLWCQIKADVLGRPVRRLRVLHSGVLGAALLAGRAADVLPDVRDAAKTVVRVGDVFEPNAAVTDRYDATYALYRELYPALKPAYATLSGLRASSIASRSEAT
jgi:xylulokinase